MERVASLEAREARIAEQEAKLPRPQEPPPVSSARVDAHLATTEAAAGDAVNAAETAAETAGPLPKNGGLKPIYDGEGDGSNLVTLSIFGIIRRPGGDVEQPLEIIE